MVGDVTDEPKDMTMASLTLLDRLIMTRADLAEALALLRRADFENDFEDPPEWIGTDKSVWGRKKALLAKHKEVR